MRSYHVLTNSVRLCTYANLQAHLTRLCIALRVAKGKTLALVACTSTKARNRPIKVRGVYADVEKPSTRRVLSKSTSTD